MYSYIAKQMAMFHRVAHETFVCDRVDPPDTCIKPSRERSSASHPFEHCRDSPALAVTRHFFMARIDEDALWRACSILRKQPLPLASRRLAAPPIAAARGGGYGSRRGTLLPRSLISPHSIAVKSLHDPYDLCAMSHRPKTWARRFSLGNQLRSTNNQKETGNG